MNKRAFYQNTAVMTITSLLLRLLGIVFRIFISNRVGAEGMGLYQLVFAVYILGATFATGSGLQVCSAGSSSHTAVTVMLLMMEILIPGAYSLSPTLQVLNFFPSGAVKPFWGRV